MIVIGTLNARVSAEDLAEARRAIKTEEPDRTNAIEGVTLLLREPPPSPPGSVRIPLSLLSQSAYGPPENTLGTLLTTPPEWSTSHSIKSALVGRR